MISSCWVNTTSRQGIKHIRISFSSIFLLVSYESGATFIVSGENSRSLALNDSPEVSIIFKIIPLERLYYPGFNNIGTFLTTPGPPLQAPYNMRPLISVSIR